MQRLADCAPFYEAKTFHYPDGGVETVAWRRLAPVDHDMLPPARKRTGEPSEENREKSIRRAKTKLRRLARSMGVDRLLTLTTREESTDFDELVRDWDLLRRKVVKAVPGFRYLAVAEPHPTNRDHYHIHVAVKGFMDVNVLRRCWHEVLRRRIKCDGSPGNVDLQKKRGGTPEKVAKYLAKYLGKTFETAGLTGRKSYWRSAKAGEAVKINRWHPWAATWAELEAELVGDDCICEVRWGNPAPGILWLEAWRLP